MSRSHHVFGLYEEDGVSDQAIREAAGHVTGAANSVELAVGEIMAAFREGRFDPEPVGSPPYVRRKRDEAAIAALSGVAYMPSAEHMAESLAADRAFLQANALVTALGYQVPEEPES